MTHSVRFALAGGIAMAGMIWLGGCATQKADWLVRREAREATQIAQAGQPDSASERRDIPDTRAFTRDEQTRSPDQITRPPQ